MKSPITLVNKSGRNSGFLLPEIIIAFSLMTLFLVSTTILSATMHALHAQAEKNLENIPGAISGLASSTKNSYGNDSYESSSTPLTLLSSDYIKGWGRDNCYPRLVFDPVKIKSYDLTTYLGAGNIPTDLEVRNGIAYVTTDSTTATAPDFFIIDMTASSSPHIISSLNTGPGLSSLEVAGPYVYAANTSTTNQLQIIDIHDRMAPVLMTKFKLPLPNASSTPTTGASIFYSKGFIYLGTPKWEGDEFSILDVSNPASPQYVNGFETSTLINDIYVRDGFAYLAASDIGQMRILDIHNPLTITQSYQFSPSGWQSQEGRALSYFEGKLSLGRTTGGFNNVSNHEFFLFATTSPLIIENSHDIPGGVYGMVIRPPYVYLATKSSGHEFQVWKDDFSAMVFETSTEFPFHAMACDKDNLILI